MICWSHLIEVKQYFSFLQLLCIQIQFAAALTCSQAVQYVLFKKLKGTKKVVFSLPRLQAVCASGNILHFFAYGLFSLKGDISDISCSI